jgi:DNA-binding transcriptional LysR family regulator
MAQPALSRYIGRLETDLDTRLFERTSRRVELSPAGRLLLDEARDLVARAERIRTIARRSRDDGSLRVGIPGDLGSAVIAALIATLRERLPTLVLDLRPSGTVEQLRGLADGTLDAGVLRHPCPTRGLTLGPMLLQSVGVLLPVTSILARAREVHPADLAGRDLVAFPREDAPGAYDKLLTDCRGLGFVPPVVHRSPHPQFALGLVLAGAAVALAPRGEDAPGVVWRPLSGDPLAWQTSCAWREGERTPPKIPEFVTIATEVLRTAGAMTDFSPAAPRRVVLRPSSGFLA